MKKYIATILLIIICYFGYGQSNPYPLTQNIGSSVTKVQVPANGALYGGLIPLTFADTTAASAALTYGVTYNGFIIYSSSDSALFFRCCGASKWQQILPSGGSGGLRAWLIGGQGGLFTSPVDPQIIGVTTNQPFGFMTNNVNRVIVPAAGLSLLTLQSDTTLNKPMTYNTSTKEWNYGYWFGGGSGSTPTWQQTLTAGSTLTGSNTVLLSGFDLEFQGNGADAFNIIGVNSFGVSDPNGTRITASTTQTNIISPTTATRSSSIYVSVDDISVRPGLGAFYIDTLTNLSTQDELLGRRNSTGQVGYITLGSGLSLAAGVLSATGSGTTWNAITNPTGDQALTFDAGESSTWTDANTTEDLFTVNSSTGTTNSMFSLNRTGTALAAGNNILELVSSGANGTNAITATGARISVTNTNATSGTNVGLSVTATGATTNNYSIQATGAMTLTAAAQTPASFESSFAGNMQVNWNSTTGNNVNFVFQDAGTIRWYVGNNSATGSDRLHILNQSASEAVTVLQGLQVGINNTAPTARLHIGAGAATASYAPLKFTTGTSNTTAEAGAMEYTTPQLFFTNGRAVRQELFQGQQARVSTQYDNATTTLGNVTGLTVNVAASGTYRFVAKLFTTSDVAGGVKVAIGGTATATSIRYEGITTDAGLSTQGRATALGTAVGAVTAVTAAWITIEGVITVNGAGTLTTQFAANAATGTSSVLTGSTFVVTEMN